jgi:hypothetical protein
MEPLPGEEIFYPHARRSPLADPANCGDQRSLGQIWPPGQALRRCHPRLSVEGPGLAASALTPAAPEPPR